MCRDDAYPFIQAWRGTLHKQTSFFLRGRKTSAAHVTLLYSAGICIERSSMGRVIKMKEWEGQASAGGSKVPLSACARPRKSAKASQPEDSHSVHCFGDLIARSFQGQSGYSPLPSARKRKLKPLLQVFLANAYFSECTHTSRLPPAHILLGN